MKINKYVKSISKSYYFLLFDEYPNETIINKYTKKLQDNGYTIVVYEEVGEDPIKKTKIRNQTGIFSPGTFFSTDPAKITNNICCLWIELQKRAFHS